MDRGRVPRLGVCIKRAERILQMPAFVELGKWHLLCGISGSCQSQRPTFHYVKSWGINLPAKTEEEHVNRSQGDSAFPRKWQWGDFPGGPVAKTPHSQCRGLGSIPSQGTRSHVPQLRVPMPPLNILSTITKTWRSQTHENNWKKNGSRAWEPTSEYPVPPPPQSSLPGVQGPLS